MKTRILIPLLALLLPAMRSQAQPFTHQSTVDKVQKAGYHDILMPPALTALLEPAMNNLRLRDSLGGEVPFILKNEAAHSEKMDIEWLPRVNETYWAHWYSRCFFSNPRQELLDRMVLRIRNADVQQRFWLSGSDNMNEWYIIKEDYVYDSDYNTKSGSSLVTIHFPPVDYKYFKVELRHHWREPIQIMGAGVYRFDSKSGRFSEIPLPSPAQAEEGQHSVVTVDLNGNHHVERVYFEIDGPELYHREAVLEGYMGEAGGTWQELKRVTLSSREEGMVSLDNIRARKLRLRIDNLDDRPLKVVGVRAWQTRKYLVARLSEGQRYSVYVGEPDLRAAQFDLAHFEEELPALRPVVGTSAPVDLRSPATPGGAPQPKVAEEQPKEEVKPLLEHPGFIWGAVALVVLLVGYMAIRMLKDMKPKP